MQRCYDEPQRMATETETGYTEPTIQERRWHRMKHLRIDRMTFADMTPILIAEGLLPEHEKHLAKPPRVPGSRGPERAAQVCGHCEHTIHEQWRKNVARLKLDEAEALEVRFLWKGSQLRIAEECRRDYKGTSVTRTVKRKRLETSGRELWPILVTNEDGTTREEFVPVHRVEGVAFVVEEVVRTEERIYPALKALESAVLDKVARVDGLELDEPDDDPLGDDERRPYLVVKRPAGRGGRNRGEQPLTN